MSEIDDFKKSLGPIASKYTDEELYQLRAEIRLMADLLLDIYLDRARSDGTSQED
jgi:hypothetical protein